MINWTELLVSVALVILNAYAGAYVFNHPRLFVWWGLIVVGLVALGACTLN